MTILRICNKIIEYSFYLLFFLVPLILASDTSELFEFNKMWLTYGVTLIVAAAWFTKMILQTRIQIQRTALDIPILLFLLSQLISTFFSWDVHVSFWGYYSRFNGGLLSTLTYIFLYYAFVSNFAQKTKIVMRSIIVSLASGLVVALWGLPSHFGHDPTCFLFRHAFDVSCWTEDFQPRVRIFSTLGQPDWLAAYLAILLPVTIVMFIKSVKNLPSIFYLLLSALFYTDLFYSQAKSGIIAGWLSIGLFFIGYLWIEKKRLIKLSILLILLITITFFIGTPFPQLSKFSYPGIKAELKSKTSQKIESKPSKQETAKEQMHVAEFGGTDSGKIRSIVWRGAIEAWKQNPIFGTGVETFAYAYYRYKLPSHNLTSEWNFLYNKAHNEYLNYLATTGIVGLGSYLLIIGTFIFQFFRYSNHKSQITNHKQIQNTKDSNTKRFGNWNLFGIWNLEFGILQLALLASYISILVTNFFGFSVVITNIYLFMVPAFVFTLAGMLNPKKQFIFPRNESRTTKISLYQWTFVIAILFTVCYLLFTLIKFWFADKNYSLGYNLDRAGEYVKAYPYLHIAVEQRGEPVFKDELAVNDAVLAVTLLTQKDSGGNKEDLKTKANNLAKEAIDTSDQLITDHENNVVFWKTRVRIFYTLSQADPRFLTPALEAIQKASKLAPNDASISYNLGVLYGQNNDLQKSIQTLENTIKLKPDYQDAHYALGLIYHDAAIDAKGKVVNRNYQQRAVEAMQYIIDHSPNNSGPKEALKSWEKK